jgi:predicted MarR family transcription regulator
VKESTEIMTRMCIVCSVHVLYVVVHSDRQKKVVDICQNIHESIYDLVTNMSTLSPPVVLASSESEISASYISDLGAKEPSSYTQVSS